MVKVFLKTASSGDQISQSLDYEHIEAYKAIEIPPNTYKIYGYVLLCKLCDEHLAFKQDQNFQMHKWITEKHAHNTQEVLEVNKKLDRESK